MKKIVINDCYGGFSVSKRAIELAREISGNPLVWNCPINNGEAYDTGEIYTEDSVLGNNFFPGVKRDDPLLVQVVETLGDEAYGRCSHLKVETVEGKWRINDYDGYESIEQPDDISWNE